MKIAFNTTNIHQGGALQVAVSFIDEFCNDPEMNGCVVDLFISSSVLNSLPEPDLVHKVFNKVTVNDAKGLCLSNINLWRIFNLYDKVFTLFGPSYMPKLNAFHIIGFGQAWVLSRKTEAYEVLLSLIHI